MTPGDNLLAEFPSVVDAVTCAVEVQRQLEARNADLPLERQMRFRIGINLGDVIEEQDGTIYGDGVNIAARVEALAEAGGICISERVYDDIRNKPEIGTEYIGERNLKNVGFPVKVYAVVPSDAVQRRGGPISRLRHLSRRPRGFQRRSVYVSLSALVVIVAVGVVVMVVVILTGRRLVGDAEYGRTVRVSMVVAACVGAGRRFATGEHREVAG